MTEICFGSTKMGIFYREKAFHAGEKIRKNDFAPSKKYACWDGTQDCSPWCCNLKSVTKWVSEGIYPPQKPEAEEKCIFETQLARFGAYLLATFC